MLKIICLAHCPYSENTKNIVNRYKIKHKLITIHHDNKHKYKKDLDTFPQIYFNNKLFGGNNNFQILINNLLKASYDDIMNSFPSSWNEKDKCKMAIYLLTQMKKN